MSENNSESSSTSRSAPAAVDHPGRDRRRFLNGLVLALGGLASFLVGVPIIGFLVAPLFRRPPRIWRPVGALDDFKINEITEVAFEDASSLPWAGLTSKTAAWLYRQGPLQFVAYSANCSHLGCPVRWEAQAKLFMCPCHGGVYYQNGSVAAGPPPRGLTQYPVRINNGEVEILTSPAPIA